MEGFMSNIVRVHPDLPDAYGLLWIRLDHALNRLFENPGGALLAEDLRIAVVEMWHSLDRDKQQVWVERFEMEASQQDRKPGI